MSERTQQPGTSVRENILRFGLKAAEHHQSSVSAPTRAYTEGSTLILIYRAQQAAEGVDDQITAFVTRFGGKGTHRIMKLAMDRAEPVSVKDSEGQSRTLLYGKAYNGEQTATVWSEYTNRSVEVKFTILPVL
jgi:hypothetical protein